MSEESRFSFKARIISTPGQGNSLVSSHAIVTTDHQIFKSSFIDHIFKNDRFGFQARQRPEYLVLAPLMDPWS